MSDLDFWAHGLLTMLVVGIGDVFWARYSAAAAHGRRWDASLWAVGIYLAGSIAVINYTGDHRMIAFALVGAFAGTALGVKEKQQ